MGRESLAFWEDLMSSALIFQPACTWVYNSQLFKACAAPETTVHWVMDGFPSPCSCIFILSQWAIRGNTEVIYVLHNVYMMVFTPRVRVLRIYFVKVIRRVCARACVCLYLLHSEDQNKFLINRMRIFEKWGHFASPHKFKWFWGLG